MVVVLHARFAYLLDLLEEKDPQLALMFRHEVAQLLWKLEKQSLMIGELRNGNMETSDRQRQEGVENRE